jgi:hypothetical protein
MTVEGKDGVVYTFPNVELTVTPNIETGLEWGDPGYYYEKGPDRLTAMKIDGWAFPGTPGNYIILATKEKNVATCKVPELYEDDLVKIMGAMDTLDVLSRTGVFACEIRVKTDDVDTWIVIGYGEDGAPAILRFEKDSE